MEVTLKKILEANEQKQRTLQRLLSTIVNKDYAAAETILQQEGKTTLILDSSYDLCSCAIQNGCSVEFFRLLLQYCKPLMEIHNDGARRNAGIFSCVNEPGGLIRDAIKWNNAAVLEYLLEHGFRANANWAGMISPLEYALIRRAPDVLRLLCRRDDVDFTVTDRILNSWGAVGMAPEADACFRIVTGRLLGEGAETAHEEIPLLPGLTVRHAAAQGNWPLVFRLCREGSVTEEEGKHVLHLSAGCCTELNVPHCARLLNALLAACPGLLRCEEPRYLLAVCMLQGEEEVVRLLRPWVEQMPGRMIKLCGRGVAGAEDDLTGHLHKWEARMGPRLQPVLRRNRELPVRFFFDDDVDQRLRTLFQYCAVWGTPPKGRVSHLASDVLQQASPALLAELLKEGKVFPEEDFSALVQYCESQPCLRRREKRALLLAYFHKEVSYEL